MLAPLYVSVLTLCGLEVIDRCSRRLSRCLIIESPTITTDGDCDEVFLISDDDKCYGENMSLPENYKKFEFDSGNEE